MMVMTTTTCDLQSFCHGGEASSHPGSKVRKNLLILLILEARLGKKESAFHVAGAGREERAAEL